jgi:hypothetical protein
MSERWKKLQKDFYSFKKRVFNLSKIPDIYDCIKYDVLHNKKLALFGVQELHQLVKAFADVIISQEYGIDTSEKIDIAARIAHHLLRKIYFDMTAVTVEDTVELIAADEHKDSFRKFEGTWKNGPRNNKDDKERTSDTGTSLSTSPVPPDSSLSHKSLNSNSTSVSMVEISNKTLTSARTTAFEALLPIQMTKKASVDSDSSPSSPMSVNINASPHLRFVTSKPTMAVRINQSNNHLPVPLGHSVSGSKEALTSSVPGLVISIKQHPALAYTSRVRRKSAPPALRNRYNHPVPFTVAKISPAFSINNRMSELNGPQSDVSYSNSPSIDNEGFPGNESAQSPKNNLSHPNRLHAQTSSHGTMLVSGIRLRAAAAAAAAAAAVISVDSTDDSPNTVLNDSTSSFVSLKRDAPSSDALAASSLAPDVSPTSSNSDEAMASIAKDMHGVSETMMGLNAELIE